MDYVSFCKTIVIWALIVTVLTTVSAVFVPKRWKTVCLFAYFSLVVFVLFCPLRLAPSSKLVLTILPVTCYNVKHVVQNVLLFVPLGYFLAEKTPFVRTVSTLAVFSLVAETVQYFTVGRVADVNDFVANTLGAVVGAVAVLFKRRFYNAIHNTGNMFTPNNF